ncbi:hypothetical protein CRYUN_Cryun03dG0014800 [Craigia yunnanensis]
MFPWLAYGHIMPFLHVSEFLAQKGHHIYYISTPKNISRLPKLPPHLCSNITFIPLPLPQVDGLPPGVESTSELPIHKVPYLKKAHDKLEAQLTEFLKKSSQVRWIIHDFAPHWLPPVATQLGINLVFFSIVCASTIAFAGPPSEMLSRQRPEDFTVVPVWMDYPNNIAFKLHETVSHQECMDEDVSDFQRTGQVIQGCQFVTMRSCFEFEPDQIQLLSKLYQKPVVPVRLLPPSLPSNEDKRDEEWEATKKWLDSKEKKSVFYVALGSEVSLSQELTHQLAFGLEKSNLPFIWVVRNRPLVEGQMGHQNKIPPGFEERVSDRGLVLRDWAPQLRILAHSYVGGLLTHCGWSSIIEALKLGWALILFSGVSSDQGLNARLLHGKKVGLEIERNEQDGSFTSDLVAKTIRQVMVEPEREMIRANAWAMRETFDNEELSNNYLEGFNRLIEGFAPSALEV